MLECDYLRNPYISEELLQDGDRAQVWLVRNSQLFQFLIKHLIYIYNFVPLIGLNLDEFGRWST